MRYDRPRALPRTVAVLAGVAVALGAIAAPAGADKAPDAKPPGNKGTVKIHRSTTPDDDRRNEPKVCAFRIVGFGFPDDAHIELSIEGHGGPNAGSGSFDDTIEAGELSPEGDWAIAGPSLPDGMYKLTADNTTAPGNAKHKVFKVDCDGEEPGGTTGGDTTGGDTTGGDTTGGDTTGGDTTGGDTTGGDTTGGDTTGGDTTGGDTTGGDTTGGDTTGGDTTGGDTTGGDTTGTTGGDTTGGTAGVAPTQVRPPADQDSDVLGTTVRRDGEALPRTGSDLSGLIVLGTALIVGGTALVLRRRAHATTS